MSAQPVFFVDKQNARIMGVCAGLSEKFGIDVTLVRVASVLLTICALGLPMVAAYLIAGLVAPEREPA